MRTACIVGLHFAVAIASAARAEDWPMYQRDARRSGYTPEQLPKVLQPRWTFKLRLPPTSAWTRENRMTFDRACQPVIGDGKVFFGHSANGKVYALDAATGTLAWAFFTDGPVRFAPVFWRDRIFVASDDGHLYALSASEGKLIWKVRGGPGDDMVLGNGYMCSKWPARGGPVVDDGALYYGSGIWPTDGVFVYALDPATGKVLWCNSESAHLRMQQPHKGAMARSGIAAQGYLVSAGNGLIVPSGRAVPACLDRATGKLRYFRLNSMGSTGGGMTTVIDNYLVTGGFVCGLSSGAGMTRLRGRCVVATPEGIITADKNSISLRNLRSGDANNRGGSTWTVPDPATTGPASAATHVTSMIAAAGKVICGGDGRVDVIDRASNSTVTTLNGIDGAVHGLAYADENLIASTSTGHIYCFGQGGRRASAKPSPKQGRRAPAKPPSLASEIVKKTGISKGFCLDLECGDGSLATALASQTELRIVATTDDGSKLGALRRKFEAAGLYGDRVVVLRRDPGKTGLPDYFADLIVSGSGAIARSPALRQEAERLQRPHGGVVCFGLAGKLQTDIRGPLEGAGQWTHQYANARNTLCSGDTRVRGDLTMLWYRDYDIELTNRHNRGPSPLYDAGRVFHFGRHEVIAVDAYNGRELWRYRIQDLLSFLDYYGITITSGVACAGDGTLYVRSRAACYCINAATGELRRKIPVPGVPDGHWGYVAYSDGVLYGASANKEYVPRNDGKLDPRFPSLSEAESVFAVDPKTGRQLWRREAEKSIRHNSIAIDDTSVYLIDRELDPRDKSLPPTRRQWPRHQGEYTYAPGILLALDKKTGRLRWQNDKHINGTVLIASDAHKTIVMTYQVAARILPSEHNSRMVGFDCATGNLLWDVTVGARRGRAVVVDRTLYQDDESRDILTGKKLPIALGRTHGCGGISGSQHMLLFRSGTLGYFKLDDPKAGVKNYGGIRPGCYLNIVPAGGLVLMPDSTERCTCSYLNKTWFALRPSTDPSVPGSTP